MISSIGLCGSRVLEVIETDLEMRGKGVPGNPVRRIVQYWSKDGDLLAENDPCPPMPEVDERPIRAKVLREIAVRIHEMGGGAADLDDFHNLAVLLDSEVMKIEKQLVNENSGEKTVGQ